MALPLDELDRRITAAAALQGLGKRQLRDALEDYGANRTLAEAMIRGDQPQNARNIRDLAEALGMPQLWFTAESWQRAVREAPASGTDLAEQARHRAARALAQGRQRSQETPRAIRPNEADE